MRRVYCAECRRVEYRQAIQTWHENTAPRRETLTDWIVALVTWTVCCAALVAFYFWAWSAVMP